MVTEWVPHRNVIEYVRIHSNVDRVCLVSTFLQPKDIIAQFPKTIVDRRSPGTSLSPLIRGDTPELKAGQSYALNSATRDIVLMKLVKQNILVNAAGRACLSDIGFTTSTHDEVLDEDDAESSDYRWRAPEVLKDGRFSKQSDIFSFGFVAAEVRLRKRRVLQPQSTMHRYS